MSYPELVNAMLDAGLLQFGAFEQTSGHAPYQLRLQLLPSYPMLLAQTAKAVTKLIDVLPLSRLVCTRDTIPLATLISQTLNLPLVIHSGTLGKPAHNLIGAYDVGHPAVLISLTTDIPADFVSRLVTEAGGVGLRIESWVSLIETLSVKTIRHNAVINLRDVAEQLVEQGELSAAMAARVIGAD